MAKFSDTDNSFNIFFKNTTAINCYLLLQSFFGYRQQFLRALPAKLTEVQIKTPLIFKALNSFPILSFLQEDIIYQASSFIKSIGWSFEIKELLIPVLKCRDTHTHLLAGLTRTQTLFIYPTRHPAHKHINIACARFYFEQTE